MIETGLFRRLSLAGPALALIVAWTAAFGQEPAGEPGKYVINLRAADIRALAEQVSQITQRTMIIDPAVSGEVTVISQEPLDKEGVWDLFQSVLRVQGFVAIRSGTIWRVIPQANMREAGVELSEEGGPSGRFDMVTRLVQLANFPATTAVDALRPLVASFGYIQSLPETNTLVITDNSENVDRIEEIARTLDQGDGSQVSTIPVRNADAKDIAAGLTSVLDAGDSTGIAPRVAIDARSNVLLVRGTPEMIERVRTLVAELDQPGRELPSKVPITRVYRLQFADSASMVQVLRGVVGGQAVATSSVVDSIGTGAPPVQDASIANGFGQADSDTTATERQLSFTPAEANFASEDITIQAARDINAVVIRARAEVQSDLGALVAQLDQRRPQVLIEAAIAEISGDIAEQLGVQLGFGDSAPQAGFAATSFSNSGLALANILKLLNVPSSVALSSGLTIGLSEEDKYGILIQALGTSSKANLLSTPSVTTLDNQAASILVGQNVPFRTGTYATGGQGEDPFTTIERQDIGIKLAVTPRVSQGNVVQLDVSQEVSSISNTTVEDAADIITNRRLIQTSVLADNGGTIVLGGLITDDRTSDGSKIPGLGDIPVVGRLFSSTAEQGTKRVLFVFLRPTILRTRSDIGTVSANRFQRLRAIEARPGGGTTNLLAEPKPIRRLPMEINGLY